MESRDKKMRDDDKRGLQIEAGSAFSFQRCPIGLEHWAIVSAQEQYSQTRLGNERRFIVSESE